MSNSMQNPLLKKTNGGSGNKLVEVEISAQALEIGMHVCRLDRPWHEVPILYQNFTLDNQTDIDTLQEHCQTVFIEIEEGFLDELNVVPQQPKTDEQIQAVTLNDALPKAKIAYQDAQEHIEEVFNRIESEEMINLEDTRGVIRSCVSSILTNSNAMLWLTNIKDQDKYTAQHCMRVGIFSIALGRQIGVLEEELDILGLCGLLHDVGKTKIPNDILNKPGKLTRIEFDIMREHSQLGADILSSYQDLEPIVSDSSLHHHERVDGKGYPEGVYAGYLNKYVRIVSVVDAYDAITSDRPYKKGSMPVEALKILYAERDKHFDKELVESFIQLIGVYPPGSLVEMTNGQVGVVLSSNAKNRLKPKIEIMLDANKKRIRPVVVNLEQEIMDANGEPYTIATGLPNGEYGIDVKDYLPQ